MLDPKDIKRVVNCSDIVVQCLSKWGITFKIPMIRCQVAALGYQFIWNGLSREETTQGLLEIGFDNLTVIQIMEAFVKLSHRLAMSKEEAKKRPSMSSAKRMKWEEQIKARAKAGKY